MVEILVRNIGRKPSEIKGNQGKQGKPFGKQGKSRENPLKSREIKGNPVETLWKPTENLLETH